MHANVCRRIARWVIRLLQLALLVAVSASVILLVVLPRATHGAALTVLTGSMTPTIPVGSVVLDRPVDPGTLHVGDIATYQKSAGHAVFITHRIVGINARTTPTTFVFKGDANRGPDLDPVPATAIRGKVWFHVAHLGTIRDSLQSRGMRPVLLLLAMIGLVLYAVRQLISVRRDRQFTSRAVGAEPADPLTLRAVLLNSAFIGADAAVVARLLGAELQASDANGFSLLLRGPSTRVQAVQTILEPFCPVELTVTNRSGQYIEWSGAIDRLRQSNGREHADA